MLSQADLYRAFDTAPDTIVSFLRWLTVQDHLPPTPHLADIGAGPGRLVAPLAALGWRVTAYEPDHDYFLALETVTRGYRNVMAKKGGFEDVSEMGAFDLACGINSSYAHLLAASQRATALRQLARALHPNGLLILDLPNFPWILANYRPPTPEERQWEGRRIQRYRRHQIDRQVGTFTTTDRDEVSGGAAEAKTSTKTHTYAIVSHETHLSELAAAGFRDLRLFPSFEAREPISEPASRLIYVARPEAEQFR